MTLYFACRFNDLNCVVNGNHIRTYRKAPPSDNRLLSNKRHAFGCVFAVKRPYIKKCSHCVSALIPISTPILRFQSTLRSSVRGSFTVNWSFSKSLDCYFHVRSQFLQMKDSSFTVLHFWVLVQKWNKRLVSIKFSLFKKRLPFSSQNKINVLDTKANHYGKAMRLFFFFL